VDGRGVSINAKKKKSNREVFFNQVDGVGQYNTVKLWVHSTRFNVQLFVVNFNFSFSISSGSGLDFIKYQHSSKPCLLCVMP